MNIREWITQFHRKADMDGHGERTRNWSNLLTGVTDELCSLTVSTEQEFLDIGEKLQDFYSRAQTMSEMSSTVVELMTGDEICAATSGLTGILDELKHHLGSSEQHFSRISTILRQYIETLRKVTSQLDDFKMLVLNLSMLGFFTRVENAHVFTDNTGFATLTDDVRKLSESIDEKSSSIKSKSLDLLALIHQAMSDITASEKSQRGHARSMLDHTVANQGKLEQKNDSATVSAKFIKTRSLSITGSIGDIVSSLQFHDITRQQIEHVKEILDKVNETITGDVPSVAAQACILTDVCSLQIAQLSQSQQEFSSAIATIFDNLEVLAQGVQEILGETQEVALGSGFAGMGFMEEIDSGITTVIKSLDNTIQEQMRLTGTMTSVSDMVSEMSLFIREIEYMGQNLQLIALNSRIKAAHMGREGATLDTISEGIYELSKNSRNDTKNLAAMLSEIIDVAQGFDEDIARMQQSQKEQVQDMVNNLHGITTSLHRVNERVVSVVSDMKTMGESLMNDIQAAIGEITLQDRVEHVLRRTQEQLDEITAEASTLLPEEQTGEDKAYLKEFNKLYTMESERAIHMRHLERHNPGADDCMEDAPDGLGDNVELF